MTRSFELKEKCKNCKLKECIGCEITYSDIISICNTDQWYIDKIRELEDKISKYKCQLDLEENYYPKTKLKTWLKRFEDITQDLRFIEGTDCEAYKRYTYYIVLLKRLLEE